MSSDTIGDHPQAAGHTQESACLNCGTALIGPHCHSCGQVAHVHRTLGAFFHDLLHGVFHFEGRVWRTLPALVLHPGRLTRDYVDGHRVRYVSPIALFLFTVFLLFTAMNLSGGHFVVPPTVKVNQADLAANPPLVAHTLRNLIANPALTAYKLQSYAYKYTWVLIPLSAPFLWLLFPFSRRFGLYDHTVFVTYSLCAMTLLVLLGMGLAALGLGGFAALLVLVPPVHIYAQLRGTYGGSRWATLLRTAALLLFALVALALFALLVVAQSGA